MPTHPVYDMLLQAITEDLERKVLGVLLDRAGQAVTRQELVQAVFGYRPAELAGNIDDRKIRVAIENLQAHEYPIVASSGAAGYTLSADEKRSILTWPKLAAASPPFRPSARRCKNRAVGFRLSNSGRPARPFHKKGCFKMPTKYGTFCQICAKARATTTAYRDGPNGRRTYHVCEKCAGQAIAVKKAGPQ